MIVFLKMKMLRIIWSNINVYLVIKDYSNKTVKKLKKRFKNTFKFSNNDINKFIFLSRKDVYPYEDMGEKFTETTLPEKEKFYSKLNVEDITYADYMYAKRRISRFGSPKQHITFSWCFRKF